MNYPLLSEYVESIRSAEDNLAELNHLHPVLDANGDPVMTGGNFAVVFKMQDKNTGKYYALKCFTRDQDGRAESYKMIAEELDSVDSSYITHFKYFDKELFVDTANSDETEYPVLQMDWVEGKTLDKYIRENINDQYALEMLAYQFSRLAMWLLPQPFAHGDLKPDNIIVCEDGSLTLVDYDGMYVPAMKGQKARELGSPDFRHPSRTADEFNEHIDDFPIASILLSLKAIALQPGLLEEYGAKDRLLLSEADYRNISGSQFFKQVFPSDNMELNKLMNLFMLTLSENNLSGISSNLFNLQKPEDVVYSTEVTEEDLANTWIDEYGVKYSADRKRLLNAPEEIRNYKIKRGTKIICDEAFYGCSYLYDLIIPDSVISIGHDAFCGCLALSSLFIPHSVLSIGYGVLALCENLFSIIVSEDNCVYDSRNSCNAIIETKSNTLIAGCSATIIPDTIYNIGKCAFEGSKMISINIPNSVESIGEKAFSECYSLEEITFTDSLRSIGDRAFGMCTALYELSLPDSLTTIGSYAFFYCESLKRIKLSNGLNEIEKCTFEYCKSLIEITIPESVSHIGNGAFMGCTSLIKIQFPDSLISIGDNAFGDCKSLTKLFFPNSLVKIGAATFEDCEAIEIISLPNAIKFIGGNGFKGCKSLKNFLLPQSVKHIEKQTFFGCISLTEFIIPNSVVTIGEEAFGVCSSLRAITIPNSVKEIGQGAFIECVMLKNITIPKSVTEISDNAFGSCNINIVCESESFIIVNGLLISKTNKTLLYCNKSINNVIIPDCVLRIGKGVFAYNSSLTKVYFPDSIENIDDSAFCGCRSLKNIILPKGVKDIGESAFNGCESIIDVVIPDTVRRIGSGAFFSCCSLKNVYIQGVDVAVGNFIFHNCYNLEAIYIPIGSRSKFEKILPKDKLKEI